MYLTTALLQAPSTRLQGHLVLPGRTALVALRGCTASDGGEGGVAQGGEHLGCCVGVGSSLILSPGDVAHIVQAVLDPPMGMRQGQG